MTRILFVLAIVLSLTSAAMAQNVVGRSVVDGNKVLLFSDGTWDFETQSVDDCDFLSKRVAFCGSPSRWQPIHEVPTGILAQYLIDDQHYAMFVEEAIGTDLGNTHEFMRMAVVGNFALGAGIPEEDVIVLDVYDTKLGDLSGETVVYAGDISNLPFVFINSVFITKSDSVQVVTYAVGKDVSEIHASYHHQFLELTKIEGEQ